MNPSANAGQQASSWAEFPPHVLREYAFVADGYRGALLGPRGDVAWLCAPRWDGDGVFSTLIGGEGICAVTPAAPHVWGGYYEPGTLIWHDRWVTAGTTLECHEALACPADADRVVLLRRIVAVQAAASVRVVVDVRAGFGRHAMTALRREAGAGDLWTATSGGLRLRWRGLGAGTLTSGVDGRGRIVAEVAVPGGRTHDLVLEVAGGRLPPDPPDPDHAWAATRDWWRAQVPAFDDAVDPREARQAYAVLRGMTAPGGGTVAAATLGLPERADAGRNYDYRYVWLRDQAYAGLAAAVGTPHPLLDDAVRFTVARVLEHGDRLAPAYRVDGGAVPDEETLPLPGYPGGTAVVGNHVNGQFQLDAVGESLQLLATAARHDRLDPEGRRAAVLAAELIERRWTEPDAGIWELDDQWWTHSRLACIAALRAAARWLPDRAGPAGRTGLPRPTELAEEILAETSRRCLRPDGAWSRRPGHAGTDASLLLPAVRGALEAGDARTVATLRAVRQELCRDGYMYRFSDGKAPLGDAEGAFLLCGFVAALAEQQQGHPVEARHLYTRTALACGSPGLLAEEFDVRQRQLRGNLPQAFVHALLLEAGQRLATSYPPTPGA